MEKKDVMLCAWKFNESHTGVNIAAAILSHVRQWEIEVLYVFYETMLPI